MQTSDVFRQTPDLEISKMPDGYVIYRPEADRVVFLNTTAAVILELSDGKLTLAEIAEILREGYDLQEFPQAEFDTCVQNLIEHGLVTKCPG